MNEPTRQVSFRIDEDAARQMKAAAMNDGIRELGPFCRLLMEWAFGHYKKAKSLYLLKQTIVEYPRMKRPRNR
jgi:hypothetical protein